MSYPRPNGRFVLATVVISLAAPLWDSTPTYYGNRSLRPLVAAANVPLYTYFVSQIGNGPVGGSFFDVDRDAERAADTARRILAGEPERNIPIQTGTFKTVVDWRQLKSWQIGERNLPAGTVVLFREPSVWTKYRSIVIGSLAVFVVELALIAWLAWEVRRRRLSEAALKALSGCLLKAQEEERARLARELHDGVNQRVALLGISLSGIKSRIPADDSGLRFDLKTLQDVVTDLGKEIRRLSHDLHPPILKLLGLDQALKQYCAEFGAAHGMDIQFTSNIGSDRLSQQSELCLYRIAQEALRNIVKHASTTAARVSLIRTGEEYTLSIRDSGRGFDPRDACHCGLGVLSMQERIEALDGKLSIWSKVNHGTIITARLPVNRTFSLESQSADQLAESF